MEKTFHVVMILSVTGCFLAKFLDSVFPHMKICWFSLNLPDFLGLFVKAVKLIICLSNNVFDFYHLLKNKS